MTVAEVHEMSNAEYLQWAIFLARKAQKQQLEEMKAKARNGN